MKKLSNPAAFYSRLQILAEVNKNGVKDSKNRGIGTLIDYKKSTNGTSYGIIKENHHYYIKKSGLKESPDVSDFTYIGGMENITEYQYKSLAEADKKRNMMLHVINESETISANKSKTKIVQEDAVDDKIKTMSSTANKLDAATAAKKETDSQPNPQIPDLTDDQPIPDQEDSSDELDIDNSVNGDETDNLPEEDNEFKEIQSDLGKAIEKIQNKELSKTQVKTVLNSVTSALKQGLTQFEVKEREDLAEPIIKAEDVDGAADLETNMPDEEIDENEEPDMAKIDSALTKINQKRKETGKPSLNIDDIKEKYFTNNTTELQEDEEEFIPQGSYTVSNSGGYEIMIDPSGDAAKVRDAFGSDDPKTSDWLEIEYINDPETGESEPIIDPNGYNIPLNQVMKINNIHENKKNMKCSECGTFGQYAESRGYNKKSLLEADNDEKASIISGYINAFNEGKNNGDAKVISVLAKKTIVESLINDYGHKNYINTVLKPVMKTLNEATYKSRIKLLNEEFEIGNSGTESDTDDDTKSIMKDVVGEIMKIKGNTPEKAQEMLKELMGDSLNEEDITEIFGGLGDKLGAVKDTVKNGVGAVKDLYNKNLKTRQDISAEKAEAERQAKLVSNKDASVASIQQHAQALVDEIKALNANRIERGLAALPASSLFRSMANQVNSGGVDVSKYKNGVTNEGKGLPAGTVEVQPNMLKEIDDVEDDTLNNDEDTLDIDTPDDINMETETNPELDSIEIDTPEIGFAPDSSNMGFDAPDHSGINIVDVNVDGNNKTVNIKLNEAIKAVKALVNAKGGNAKPAAVTATNTKGTKQEKTGGVALVNAKGSAKATAKQLGEAEITTPTIKTVRIPCTNGLSEKPKKKQDKYVTTADPNKRKKVVSESENKTKNYIRAKIEELDGLRTPFLNESKKSPTLKKLDEYIIREYKKYKK